MYPARVTRPLTRELGVRPRSRVPQDRPFLFTQEHVLAVYRDR